MLNDPYQYLALQVFKQAFHDIKAYYTGQGRPDEIAGGRDAVEWVRKMKGTFRLCGNVISQLKDIPIDKVHQDCLSIVNEIRRQAIIQKGVGTKGGFSNDQFISGN